MARPRTQVPEETRRLVWQLRSQGYTLKQISRQTGLRYNFVQRLLSQPHSGISSPPTPRAETLVPNLSTSDTITAQTPRVPHPPAYPLIGIERNYPNRRLPSGLRKLSSREPESETTRQKRSQLEEVILSRQYWEEKAAERRAFDDYIEMIAPKKKGSTFQPRPGAILFEYSPETYHQHEAFEMNFVRGVYKDDPVKLDSYYSVSKWRWKAWSYKIVYVDPESVGSNPQQANS